MQIVMPKLGLTMTHGTITEWLKAPGDPVRAEEALCVYETEKVTLELPAPTDGVFGEILAPAGATVPAGAVVCELVTQAEGRGMKAEGQRGGGAEGRRGQGAEERGDVTGPRLPVSGLLRSAPLNATPKARGLARQAGVDLAAIAGSGPKGRVQAADVLAAGAESAGPSVAPPSVKMGTTRPPAEIKATPLARRIAAAEGLDLRTLAGTGPEGTITREDVERVTGRPEAGDRGQPTTPGVQLPSSSPQASDQIIPLSSLRRTIGERMSQSAFTAPHVTLMTEAEATNLVSARDQLNTELALPATAAGGKREAHQPARLSFNALLAALAARALREHSALNARLEADGIHLLPEINIALAVDTERGLMTPVLRAVDRLNLPDIQRGYEELIGRALDGKSLPGDFVGGTFTITNLGSLDVDGFTPIINPPQAAILGIGRIIEKPVVRDGAVVIRPMVTLSLSFDHRIVDGAPAGRFLQRIKQLVERPLALLI
jgi:pyruvate dehydrogenase E2 component (dihydrolipoamide acetyltransferase)